jgi:dihydroorotase
MKKRLLLKNGSVLFPDGRIEKEDLLIEEGKITHIGRIFVQQDMSVMDVSECFILSGMIDPHVHFREPGFAAKEGIINGSRAAIKGGVTTVFDMPNTNPPCDSLMAFEEKRKLFREKSLVNWGLHYMASPGMKEVPKTAVSAKVFMARSSSRSAYTKEEDLIDMFRTASRVAVHAEDESLFTDADRHHLRRPGKAIRSALETIKRALLILRKNERPRLILCHASTIDDVKWLSEMKQDGFDIWGETAPHYLWFTAEDEQKYGARYQVNPPLRDSADRDAIRQAVKDGIIDFIGTDHAPHTPGEKESPNPPSGIPGIEWVVPVILELVEQQNIPWSRITHLISGGAAECYGISGHSGLQPGSAADIIILKKEKKKDSIITKAGYNPYERIHLTYAINTVIINGIMVYTENRFNSHVKGKEIVSAFSH